MRLLPIASRGLGLIKVWGNKGQILSNFQLLVRIGQGMASETN